MFSFGNGVLIWPAIFIVLVCRREKVSVQAAWIAGAVLVMLAYISGYPAREPTPAATDGLTICFISPASWALRWREFPTAILSSFRFCLGLFSWADSFGPPPDWSGAAKR